MGLRMGEGFRGAVTIKIARTTKALARATASRGFHPPNARHPYKTYNRQQI
jgi:hypothetical protein